MGELVIRAAGALVTHSTEGRKEEGGRRRKEEGRRVAPSSFLVRSEF
jgi:hypothetical protein